MNYTECVSTRIALSMYVSGRKVERVPRVTEFHPWQVAEIVPMPYELTNTVVVNRYEGI